MEDREVIEREGQTARGGPAAGAPHLDLRAAMVAALRAEGRWPEEKAQANLTTIMTAIDRLGLPVVAHMLGVGR